MTGAADTDYLIEQESGLIQGDDRSNQQGNNPAAEEEPAKPIEVRSARANNKFQQVKSSSSRPEVLFIKVNKKIKARTICNN